MRRTACVLYATALAGAALGAAASGASADPAAQVSPGSVEPGGTVTVTVSCEATGGTLPDSIDASSQGFQEGMVQLHRVEGADPGAAGAASYSGTAHISSGEPGTAPDQAAYSATEGASTARGPGVPGGSGASDAKNSDGAGAADPVSGGSNIMGPDAPAPAPGAGDPAVPVPPAPGIAGPDTAGPDDVGPDTVPETPGLDTPGLDTPGPDAVPDMVGPDTPGPGTVPDTPGPDTAAPGPVDPDRADPGTGGADGRWNVGGVCPAPPGGHGKQWTASYAVARGVTATHGPDGGTGSDSFAGGRPPTVQRGVRAGEGGVFTDSVPALVTGGVLIAGALGAVAHRLHRLRRRRYAAWTARRPTR
ncbi:hypothetical protein [Streptomyces triticiradicis]|uniref:Secreted protein n=1 Tax=Streptomyces triticiradicis TaxID=2651189 RepID=A0A7J5D892_9ACTN|nr:hypothetical protein [Streptomyces triticiradicis]KAB1981419.1 hypothetical protein F8144_32585 [Streptomyces triticiradicis]